MQIKHVIGLHTSKDPFPHAWLGQDVLALSKLELETTLKDSEKKPGCAPEKEEGQEGGEAELGGVLGEGNQSSQKERCS